MDPLASGLLPQVPAVNGGNEPFLWTGTAFDDLAALAAELVGAGAGLVARSRSGGLELIGAFGATLGAGTAGQLPPEINRVATARWRTRVVDNPSTGGHSGSHAGESWLGVPLLDAGGTALGTLCVRVSGHQVETLGEAAWVSLERLARQAVRLLEAGEALQENRFIREVGVWNGELS